MSDGDPYLYPGTDVLRNKKGLKTQEALERYERLHSGNRMRHAPLDFPISLEGYTAIHRHLFQDVYDWAGETRTVDMAKDESLHTFFEIPEQIDRMLFLQFDDLNCEYNLAAMTPRKFSVRAAEHICAINNIHPFREGNGRTQRFFLKVLAHQAGHELRIDGLDRDLWLRGSAEGFRGQDYETMATCIGGALTGRDRTRSRQKQRDRSRER